MKKLILPTVLLACILSANTSDAQLRIGLGVHVNIGARPSWGVPGNYAGNFYYMPEIDSYYDITNRQFIYDDGGNWVYADNLPYYYRDYDLNRGYKVVVNEPRPYLHADFYRQQYRPYYNTYRRQDAYAQRYARPEQSYNQRFDNRFDNRNDQRFDNRNNQRFNEQRPGNNDRFDQGRGNDNRREAERNDHYDRNDHRSDNRNPQRRG